MFRREVIKDLKLLHSTLTKCDSSTIKSTEYKMRKIYQVSKLEMLLHKHSFPSKKRVKLEYQESLQINVKNVHLYPAAKADYAASISIPYECASISSNLLP